MKTILKRFRGVGFWDADATEEDIGAEHLLVTRDQVAQGSPNKVELVHVRPAGPEGVAIEQLGEHTPQGPDVHRGAVLSVPYQQLRGPVPTGRHVVRVVVPRTGEDAGEAEVTELDDSRLGEEDILRLHVTVNAIVFMTEVDRLQSLPHYAFQLDLWNPARMLVQLIEDGLLTKLKDQV